MFAEIRDDIPAMLAHVFDRRANSHIKRRRSLVEPYINLRAGLGGEIALPIRRDSARPVPLPPFDTCAIIIPAYRAPVANQCGFPMRIVEVAKDGVDGEVKVRR